MLKTSRKIFFSVVLISLLGSSSRCDAMFATLVVLAMKGLPYLIWTAPPLIIGGYQWYHNSLSGQLKRGFKKASLERKKIQVGVDENGIGIVRNGTAIGVIQTSVDNNGIAIRELAKQGAQHHQDGVRELHQLHEATQRSFQENGNVIGLVQTGLDGLTQTVSQHHNENQRRFSLVTALSKANGNTLTTLQQTTNNLTRMQRVTHIKLEEGLMFASQKHESITVKLRDNTGQLSGLIEAQKQLKQLLQEYSTSSSKEAKRTSAQLFGLIEAQKKLELLLQQRSQTHTEQLTRIEKMLQLSNQPSQLEHHPFLQLLATHHFLLQRRPVIRPSYALEPFLRQRRHLLGSRSYAPKKFPAINNN